MAMKSCSGQHTIASGSMMCESLRRLVWDDIGISKGRVRVELLDGEFMTCDVEKKCTGADLLDKVCSALDILEKGYFGLLLTPRIACREWVDLKRQLSKTFKDGPWDVRFAVKFYPPEPAEVDEVTRYQVSLAVRNDLIYNRLTCSKITYALLASYVLQAELGDRTHAVCFGQLANLRAAPGHLLTELVEKSDELYKKHKGQTPAEAELNYLESAKKLPMYGAELHEVKDRDDVALVLAVCAAGITVLRDEIILSRIPWATVSKINYRSRRYYLRLRVMEGSMEEQCQLSVGFNLRSARDAKRLWRCSVEFHMFYRREVPVKVDRITGFPRFGSRRLSCRSTLRQMRGA